MQLADIKKALALKRVPTLAQIVPYLDSRDPTIGAVVNRLLRVIFSEIRFHPDRTPEPRAREFFVLLLEDTYRYLKGSPWST